MKLPSGIEGPARRRVGLLLPQTDTNLVKGVLQEVDALGLEASAKVTCRGGIGDALGAEGIQEMEVLVPPFISCNILVAQL